MLYVTVFKKIWFEIEGGPPSKLCTSPPPRNLATPLNMHAQIRAKMKYKLTLSTFAGYAIFAEKNKRNSAFLRFSCSLTTNSTAFSVNCNQ